jgi:hypothetical protein
MFALFYGLFSGGDGRYDTHRLRPRDTHAAHWRQAYAQMQREQRRDSGSQGAETSLRRGVQRRFIWPFIGQR